MIDMVAEVRRLKDRANYQKSRADKPNGDASPDEVIEKLETAQKLLDQAINQLLPVHKVADETYKETLSRELADCYGMKGGIYRRWSMVDEEDAKDLLQKSAEMYNEGRKYEINDSYNLFNSIVIVILLDPENIEAQYPRINECIEVIQRQVRGPRIDQWWAWADLGLCNLLLEKEGEAHHAYERFTRLGPRPQDYDSTLSVLKNLKTALQEVYNPLSRLIAESIQRTIVFLRGKRGA
jgi:hypothetical protein